MQREQITSLRDYTRGPSTVAMASGLYVDVPRYCYDECNIVSSIITIKSEDQPEFKQEDNVSIQQRYVLNVRVASALQESVKCETQSQEFDVQEIILLYQNTDEGTSGSRNVKEFTEDDQNLTTPILTVRRQCIGLCAKMACCKGLEMLVQHVTNR